MTRRYGVGGWQRGDGRGRSWMNGYWLRLGCRNRRCGGRNEGCRRARIGVRRQYLAVHPHPLLHMAPRTLLWRQSCRNTSTQALLLACAMLLPLPDCCAPSAPCSVFSPISYLFSTTGQLPHSYSWGLVSELHRNSAYRCRCAALVSSFDTSRRVDKAPVLAQSCRASNVLRAILRAPTRSACSVR